MSAPRRARLLLCAAVLLILAAIVPWRSFTPHPHWAKVEWLPFSTRPPVPRDAVGNVLLFVPLGASLAWGRRSSELARVLTFAAALSLMGEATQVYSHRRFPTASDVLYNVTGAWLGAQFMHRRDRVSRTAEA